VDRYLRTFPLPEHGPEFEPGSAPRCRSSDAITRYPREVDLDWDPILSTNDDPFEHYVAGQPIAKNGRCWVRIYGIHEHKTSPAPIVLAEVVREHGRYVFASLHCPDSKSNGDENLVSILRDFAGITKTAQRQSSRSIIEL